MKFLEKETDRFVLTMVEKNIWMKDLAINYAFFQEKNIKNTKAIEKQLWHLLRSSIRDEGMIKLSIRINLNFQSIFQ